MKLKTFLIVGCLGGFFALNSCTAPTNEKDYSVFVNPFIGTGFFVMKGFMDTIPKALDEAATLDGCTRWQIFTKITLPLSKPMIVYQIITSFMAPWVDFVFAKVICRTNSQYFTVSIGLWSMLEKEYVDTWFVRFCAGAVLVSIPIAILFMFTQKFYQEAMSGAVKG